MHAMHMHTPGRHHRHSGFEDKQMSRIRECLLSQAPRDENIQRPPPVEGPGIPPSCCSQGQNRVVTPCKTTLGWLSFYYVVHCHKRTKSKDCVLQEGAYWFILGVSPDINLHLPVMGRPYCGLGHCSELPRL